MEKFFHLKENGTSIKTELIAGLTTFLTMVYIVIVNPAILSSAGVPFHQVYMATIISAAIGTLWMALFAKYPIAIAPGMGMNAYFASVVTAHGISYEAVFGAVFLAGIIFILLTFTALRETLIHAIPSSLKYGITSGIGLFIHYPRINCKKSKRCIVYRYGNYRHHWLFFRYAAVQGHCVRTTCSVFLSIGHRCCFLSRIIHNRFCFSFGNYF